MLGAQEWPNKLGYDIGDAEIWKHKDCFRVFTPAKVLRVPYAVTGSPETALAICHEQGLLRQELEDMDYRAAQALFVATVPMQKELF